MNKLPPESPMAEKNLKIVCDSCQEVRYFKKGQLVNIRCPKHPNSPVSIICLDAQFNVPIYLGFKKWGSSSF